MVFALKIACQIFHWLWNYFHIPLPLKKLDSVALPYLRPGAMENWGCMTFREKELIPEHLHESLCSFEHFQQVVNSGKIWAHEATHQWMGDFITAEGWNELWLNESFATFLSHKCMDQLFPKFCIYGKFITQDIKMVQELDWMTWSPKLNKECAIFKQKPYVLISNNPISNLDFTLLKEKCTNLEPFPQNRTVVSYVNFFQSSNHVEAVFDSITYAKGAAILRFLEKVYGEKAFQIALHYFLHSNAHRFGSFRTFKEIFTHMSCIKCEKTSDTTSFPFSSLLSQVHPYPTFSWVSCFQVLESYFLQPGFPILLLEVSHEQEHEKIKSDDDDDPTSLLSLLLKTSSNQKEKEKWIVKFQVRDSKGEIDVDATTFYVPLFSTCSTFQKKYTQKKEEKSVKNVTLDKSFRTGELNFSTYEELIQFLKVNQNGVGYYVTIYNELGYKILGELIQKQNPILSTLDKIHLLSDLFFGLRRKWIAFPIVAKFLLSYIHESNIFVLWHWFLTLREITSYFRFVTAMVSYCKSLGEQFFHAVFGELLSKIEDEEMKPFCAFLKMDLKKWLKATPLPKSKKSKKKTSRLPQKKKEEEKKEEKKSVLVIVDPEPSKEKIELHLYDKESSQIRTTPSLLTPTEITAILNELKNHFQKKKEEPEKKIIILEEENEPEENHVSLFRLPISRTSTDFQESIDTFPFHPHSIQQGAKCFPLFSCTSSTKPFSRILTTYKTFENEKEVTQFLQDIVPFVQTVEQ